MVIGGIKCDHDKTGTLSLDIPLAHSLYLIAGERLSTLPTRLSKSASKIFPLFSMPTIIVLVWTLNIPNLNNCKTLGGGLVTCSFLSKLFAYKL